MTRAGGTDPKALRAGALYSGGLTVRQVAAALDTYPSRAWRLIKAAGAPLRHDFGPPRRTGADPIVKLAVELRGEGLSFRRIAHELRVGSPSTIRRYLARAAESAAG
jgi:hypothetical protein